MNFTYYFYCDCEFTYKKPVHQHDGEIILQCGGCLHIESKEKKQGYHLICVACGARTNLGSNANLTTDSKLSCHECGLYGEIGFSEGSNVLFVLDSNYDEIEPCTKCKKKKWQNVDDVDFTCPYCLKPLKQKMSLVWESKESD